MICVVRDFRMETLVWWERHGNAAECRAVKAASSLQKGILHAHLKGASSKRHIQASPKRRCTPNRDAIGALWCDIGQHRSCYTGEGEIAAQ